MPGQTPGRVVIELEWGVTVYPARGPGDRWRAVWYENGQRRQCESVSEDRLAVRLDKVTERLATGALNLERPGADLIVYYLSQDRLPADSQWSRKHAHTQRRLCERFAAPVIDAVMCQDITTGHMQKIANAPSTPGEGRRVQGMVSALVSAGIEGGYLASPRLARVHWQAGDRALPTPQVSVAGESALFVDPAEIPADADITRLSQALATGRHGDRDELMANSCLQRAAVGRADRPDYRPGRPGRPGDRGGPQGGRGRRAPVPGGTQEPQAAADHLPPHHPGGLSAGRTARRSSRAGPR
jgi:hypothetical protein